MPNLVSLERERELLVWFRICGSLERERERERRERLMAAAIRGRVPLSPNHVFNPPKSGFLSPLNLFLFEGFSETDLFLFSFLFFPFKIICCKELENSMVVDKILKKDSKLKSKLLNQGFQTSGHRLNLPIKLNTWKLRVVKT